MTAQKMTKQKNAQVISSSDTPASLQGFNPLPTSPDVEFDMDTQKSIRHGFWVLIVGFGAFLIWAGFAPLDEGVPTEGQVSIETNSKVVQHLNGGIIELHSC